MPACFVRNVDGGHRADVGGTGCRIAYRSVAHVHLLHRVVVVEQIVAVIRLPSDDLWFCDFLSSTEAMLNLTVVAQIDKAFQTL